MSIYDAPKDTIRTNSGIYMNIFNPTLVMIKVEDIAHALAAQPRFAGHLNRHYSVAQHSVMASQLVPKPYKLEALFHDGSEAYMLDIPTPIKARMPEYKKLEDRLMGFIAQKFKFAYPLSKEVKLIDKYLVELEWDNLMINNNKNFKCLTKNQAKKLFLKTYYELID